MHRFSTATMITALNDELVELDENCYILEDKASVDAVVRVSPNVIASWVCIDRLY